MHACRSTLEDPTYRANFGEEYPDLLVAEHNLARLELYSGDLDAAGPRIEALIERRRRVLGADHTELAESIVLAARLAAKRGEHASAERHFRAALAIYEAKLEATDKRVLDSRLGLVQSLVERAEWQAAYEIGTETHARVAENREELPVRNALAAALVRACTALGRPEEAKRYGATSR